MSNSPEGTNLQEKIGDGLVRIGAMSRDQCDKVLEMQRNGDRRLFGEIALAMGFIEFQSLMNYLSRKKD